MAEQVEAADPKEKEAVDKNKEAAEHKIEKEKEGRNKKIEKYVRRATKPEKKIKKLNDNIDKLENKK